MNKYVREILADKVNDLLEYQLAPEPNQKVWTAAKSMTPKIVDFIIESNGDATKDFYDDGTQVKVSLVDNKFDLCVLSQSDLKRLSDKIFSLIESEEYIDEININKVSEEIFTVYGNKHVGDLLWDSEDTIVGWTVRIHKADGDELISIDAMQRDINACDLNSDDFKWHTVNWQSDDMFEVEYTLSSGKSIYVYCEVKEIEQP